MTASATQRLTWRDVPGWFDFQNIYDDAVAEAKDGDTLVEVGTFLGKSALYMGQKIRDSRKDLNFFTIDKFDHQDWTGAMRRHESEPLRIPQYEGLNHYDAFMAILRDSGLRPFIKHMRWESTRAAQIGFSDGSVKFVFLDADHFPESVTDDIAASRPKIVHGGVMAGHDYGDPEWPGVKQAVDRFFAWRGSLAIPPHSWRVQL